MQVDAEDPLFGNVKFVPDSNTTDSNPKSSNNTQRVQSLQEIVWSCGAEEVIIGWIFCHFYVFDTSYFDYSFQQCCGYECCPFERKWYRTHDGQNLILLYVLMDLWQKAKTIIIDKRKDKNNQNK